MSRRRAALALIPISLLIAGCGGGQQPVERVSEPPREAPAAPQTAGETTQEAAPTTNTLTLVPSDGAESVEVRVEIADDDAERSRGLMYRTALAEDAGMLFVFDREQSLSFWMRNTLIPLSIAYIDGEGRIVDLQDMEPLDDEPPNYESAEPARYALEVNRGFFEERGIEVGDTVEGLPG